MITSLIHRVPTALLSMALGVSHVVAQSYTDVGPQNGLDLIVPFGPDYYDVGVGVSFHDIDGDGSDDLSIGDRTNELKFYRNVQGSLVPMPSLTTGAGTTKSILWADLDNDGDADLVTTKYQGKVHLFHNNGDGTFTDRTLNSGILQTTSKNSGASLGDYDRDGFLDLYVCTYIAQSEPFAYNKVSHLYHNNGDGTFTDVTVTSGTGPYMRASFQSMWLDADGDGWQDIFIINDFAGANTLFRNNHDGTFTDIAVGVGLSEGPEHCMSISMCDFDVDGDQDFFITNTGIYPEVNNARSMLMVNDGAGNYTESSQAYGIDVFEWTWGALWIDHDNDGFQDLYIASQEHVFPEVEPRLDLFYKNVGGTGFVEAPELFPGGLQRNTHSVARGDLNGDGYADMIVHGQNTHQPQLWLNGGGEANHVRIGVEGTVSNRQGIGTWILVHAGGKTYTHYTVCGENYLGQSSHDVHFGLGNAPVLDSVVVQYLSGHTDRYYDLAVNTVYRFKEGETFTPRVTNDGDLVVCQPATITLDAGEGEMHVWSNGADSRTITVASSGSYHASVTNAFGITQLTDTVEVIIGPVPVVIASEVDPLCTGEGNGSITLENAAGVPAQNVIWDTSAEGAELTELPAGQYAYTFTDVNGCIAAGTVELIDPDPLFVVAIPQHTTSGTDGALAWTIFGGTAPYTQTVDGAEVTGTSLSGLSAGTYDLVVTDANGCMVETEVEVQFGVGIGEHSTAAPSLHPNPVSDVVYIAGEGTWRNWRILDMQGRLLNHGTGVVNGQLFVGDLAADTYILELSGGAAGMYRLRFVKQ